MAAFSRETCAASANDPTNPNANPIRHRRQRLRGAYRLNTTDGNKTPRQPKDGDRMSPPAFTGEQPKPDEPLRAAYGRMLTADRQFARATVNHLWKEMFGRGLVEPVNAFDLSQLDTQPSHPALLEDLAGEFIAKNYSIRELLRTIALSNTYQLGSAYDGPHPDESYFARRQPRRLSSEVLLDAVSTATGSGPQFNVRGIGVMAKANQLPDPLEGGRSPAGLLLNTFGRGDRDEVARTNEESIAQALGMMNDPVVANRVRRTAGSTVQQTLASTSDPNAIAEKLYLAALSRPLGRGETNRCRIRQGGLLAERTKTAVRADQLTGVPLLMNAFSHRNFMRIAGTGLVASWFADVIDPRLLLAETTTASPTLRNTAKSCIFIFLAGAPSQTDMWDLKEGVWTPTDFAPTSYGDVRWPQGLTPKSAAHPTSSHSFAADWPGRGAPARADLGADLAQSHRRDRRDRAAHRCRRRDRVASHAHDRGCTAGIHRPQLRTDPELGLSPRHVRAVRDECKRKRSGDAQPSRGRRSLHPALGSPAQARYRTRL
jgi:hypothetical protein